MENNVKENIMGYESIPKLIAKLSLPLMLSMLIQALYNVVDSIFVTRISETALTAVSLAYPLQSLMIAFGIGTAVGVNSYLARKLGEKKHDEAEAAADNGLFLAILTWIGFAIFGLIGTKPFISLFTDDPELLSRPRCYLVPEVRAIDGGEHDVQFYLDCGADWTVNGAARQVAGGRGEAVGLKLAFADGLNDHPLRECGDIVKIDWGGSIWPLRPIRQPCGGIRKPKSCAGVSAGTVPSTAATICLTR